jgi:hypothetical protein
MMNNHNSIGLQKIGVVDGIDIYYDEYHPDQELTVQLNGDQTEIVYIISKYNDMSIFSGLKRKLR